MVLPPGDTTVLASNAYSDVQAAEIRHEGGVFWGVQYHPEFPLRQVASILGRMVPILVEEGFRRDEAAAETLRAELRALDVGSWRGPAFAGERIPTLAEALATVARSAGWKLAELAQLDPDKGYYLEFSYKFDTTQLPGPMQFGLGGQGDWAVGATRTLKVDLSTP